jgi:SAM-dependent methyltransferase
VNDTADDRSRWQSRYSAAIDQGRQPSAWVIQACSHIPGDLTAFDIACGAGRHAFALAKAGRRVVAVDFVELAVRAAVSRHNRIVGVVADVSMLPFAAGALDLVVCVNFLDRSIFPRLIQLLPADGYIVYETYTVDHLQLVAAGSARAPTNPAYMLERGELERLLSPLTILESREGAVEDEAGLRCCASIVAVKRLTSG